MPIVSNKIYNQCKEADDMDKLLDEYAKLDWKPTLWDVGTEYDEDGTRYRVQYDYSVINERCSCGGNLLIQLRNGHLFEHCIACRITQGPLPYGMYRRERSREKVGGDTKVDLPDEWDKYIPFECGPGTQAYCVRVHHIICDSIMHKRCRRKDEKDGKVFEAKHGRKRLKDGGKLFEGFMGRVEDES